MLSMRTTSTATLWLATPLYVTVFKIATRYGLDGPGIQSRWGARSSAPVQNRSGAHPASCRMDTVCFPGLKRPGHGLDHPPHPVPRLKKE